MRFTKYSPPPVGICSARKYEGCVATLIEAPPLTKLVVQCNCARLHGDASLLFVLAVIHIADLRELGE